MDSGTEQWLKTTVEEQQRTIGQLLERLTKAEAELNASVKRRDSVEIGTPAKGGSCKIYFDASAPIAENDLLVAEARRVLLTAGGAPAPIVQGV